MKSIKLNKSSISNYDAVVIMYRFSNINYNLILKNSKLIGYVPNVYNHKSKK